MKNPNTPAFTSDETTSSTSRYRCVVARYCALLKPSRCVASSQPPITPSAFDTSTRNGITSTAARMRGATSQRNGSVRSVTSASICSVTRIVPNSAAMALATRPATISPPSTGPSSRTTPITVTAGTVEAALKRLPPMKICCASAEPVKIAVRPTTGKDSQPITSICCANWAGYHGGCSSRLSAVTAKRVSRPMLASAASTGAPMATSAAIMPTPVRNAGPAPPAVHSWCGPTGWPRFRDRRGYPASHPRPAPARR